MPHDDLSFRGALNYTSDDFITFNVPL